MTPSEALRKETEEITQRTGRYIAPYRMAALLRTAQKIADFLTTKSDICMTYEECQIILDIVGNTIKRCTGESSDV